MNVRLSALVAPALFALFQPLLAFAQQPAGPQWDWPGPWHMMGWGFSWIFPLFMLLMIAICFAVSFSVTV